MRVLLTGATGFIGGHIDRELRRRGHTVRAVSRRPDRQIAAPGREWVRGDFMSDQTAEAWAPHLEDVQALVNAAGIIRETPRVAFEPVHAAAPIALFEAAATADIARIVQVSAAGARADSPFRFLATKARADAAALQGPVDATVLRPSLVYGHEGLSADLFRTLASLPVVPLVGDGSQPFRPVLVDDVARLVVDALEADAMPTGLFEVGGEERLTLRELLLALRAWLDGERDPQSPAWTRGPTLPTPVPLVRVAALAGDLTGRGPLDSDMLGMLLSSEAADLTPLRDAFGSVPPGLRARLQAEPATEPQRWHARLQWVRTPLRLLIASIWLITPVVSLADWERSIGLLQDTGLPDVLLPTLLCLSCGLEVVVAGAIIKRWKVVPIAILQLGMIAFYTAFLSVTSPELWLDPFGPLSKNLPLIGAILALMAIDQEPRCSTSR